MKLTAYLKIVIPVLTLLTIIAMLGSAPGSSQAQGDPLPTPTNIGGGGSGGSGGSGGGDNDDDGSSSSNTSAPLPLAGISGFVYNYESAANDGSGITVRLSGGGWETEVVADTNGFYQIGGLGEGPGTISLRLPPEAKAVPIDWPVTLINGEGQQLNLGFHWSDDSSKTTIPVLLSGEINENGQLIVTVDNRTKEAATGGQLEIRTTPGTRLAPTIRASHGEVAFAAHRTQISLPNIDPGEVATTQAQLKIPETAGPSTVWLSYTYDQQITPQKIAINLSDMEASAAPLMMESQMASDMAATGMSDGETTGADMSAPEATVAPTTMAAASQPSTGATRQPTAVAGMAAATPQAENQNEASSPAPTAQSDQVSPLPSTGEIETTRYSGPIVIGLLLIIGLALGGWQAARGRG